MADQKKIIKVNDLTIQAENVHFEPIVREGRPVHPFFGPRPSRFVPSQPVETAQPEQTQDTDSKDDEATETDDQTEEQVQEQPERRPPFSWI